MKGEILPSGRPFCVRRVRYPMIRPYRPGMMREIGSTTVYWAPVARTFLPYRVKCPVKTHQAVRKCVLGVEALRACSVSCLNGCNRSINPPPGCIVPCTQWKSIEVTEQVRQLVPVQLGGTSTREGFAVQDVPSALLMWQNVLALLPTS